MDELFEEMQVRPFLNRMPASFELEYRSLFPASSHPGYSDALAPDCKEILFDVVDTVCPPSPFLEHVERPGRREPDVPINCSEDTGEGYSTDGGLVEGVVVAAADTPPASPTAVADTIRVLNASTVIVPQSRRVLSKWCAPTRSDRVARRDGGQGHPYSLSTSSPSANQCTSAVCAHYYRPGL